MSKYGAILATIGGMVVAESVGIPVVSTLVETLGGLIDKAVGATFWGIVDSLNPLNYI